ncbi:MAG: hypothetical protein JNJ50_16515 [Acidobacteria bacterium]|nr:hypothetical protein [Acidobacteriota bacterium]
MMYSQQEYDMVRRQTMQIEAEKRALLRWALIFVTILLGVALVVTGWMFRRYSTADGTIKAAETRATNAEAQLQQVSRELAEKKSILEKNAATTAKLNAAIESGIPKLLTRTGTEVEYGDLARAIYQQPGHMVELPRIPPDESLRSYRVRVDGRPYKFTFVAGLLDGKWVLYSLLVKNQEDK